MNPKFEKRMNERQNQGTRSDHAERIAERIILMRGILVGIESVRSSVAMWSVSSKAYEHSVQEILLFYRE